MSILQAPAIAVPKLAMLNLHSGLLPDYQGVMSTFRALCHRETTIGTTLHTIENADIDRGPVIARSQTPAQFDQSYLWNVLNLYREGSRNVIKAIAQLKSGMPLTSKPQQGRGRYYTFPTTTEIDAAPVSLFAQSDAEHLDHFLTD
jgi:methionyl-tRNA formyltransferase